MPDVRAEDTGRLLDPARDVGRGVHHGVPPAPLQGLEIILLAVAVELLQVGEQAGTGLPAVEQRDLMPSAERGLDGLRAEETRATQHQDRLWRALPSGGLVPHTRP